MDTYLELVASMVVARDVIRNLHGIFERCDSRGHPCGQYGTFCHNSSHFGICIEQLDGSLLPAEDYLNLCPEGTVCDSDDESPCIAKTSPGQQFLSTADYMTASPHTEVAYHSYSDVDHHLAKSSVDGTSELPPSSKAQLYSVSKRNYDSTAPFTVSISTVLPSSDNKLMLSGYGKFQGVEAQILAKSTENGFPILFHENVCLYSWSELAKADDETPTSSLTPPTEGSASAVGLLRGMTVAHNSDALTKGRTQDYSKVKEDRLASSYPREITYGNSDIKNELTVNLKESSTTTDISELETTTQTVPLELTTLTATTDVSQIDLSIKTVSLESVPLVATTGTSDLETTTQTVTLEPLALTSMTVISKEEQNTLAVSIESDPLTVTTEVSKIESISTNVSELVSLNAITGISEIEQTTQDESLESFPLSANTGISALEPTTQDISQEWSTLMATTKESEIETTNPNLSFESNNLPVVTKESDIQNVSDEVTYTDSREDYFTTTEFAIDMLPTESNEASDEFYDSTTEDVSYGYTFIEDFTTTEISTYDHESTEINFDESISEENTNTDFTTTEYSTDSEEDTNEITNQRMIVSRYFQHSYKPSSFLNTSLLENSTGNENLNEIKTKEDEIKTDEKDNMEMTATELYKGVDEELGKEESVTRSTGHMGWNSNQVEMNEDTNDREWTTTLDSVWNIWTKKPKYNNTRLSDEITTDVEIIYPKDNIKKMPPEDMTKLERDKQHFKNTNDNTADDISISQFYDDDRVLNYDSEYGIYDDESYEEDYRRMADTSNIEGYKIGTCLSPILYTLFMRDEHALHGKTLFQFADDTVILAQYPDAEVV
uniref:Uncharacterized protein n=1 Tax=Timema douglasi TaxID=61478 RepID=A0A7R8VH55_TIMDO|nr:unnamed protein product [Timema douglasi]